MECPYTGQERKEPETLVERIAWALCLHETATGDGGYLSDDELEGLTLLLNAMAARCGSIEAEAQFLACPIATVKRYVWPLQQLMRLERARRDDNSPILAAHLTAAFWPGYMEKANIAFSAALQDSRVAHGAMKAERRKKKGGAEVDGALPDPV